jgi:hypothetical protein
VWQYTAIDVASAYTWATLPVTRRNPSATWTSALARLVAADLASRGWRLERVQQTILDECWKPAVARYLIPKQTGLRLDLERYLRSYNTQRAHTGRWTKGGTPDAVLGKAKLWHNRR